ISRQNARVDRQFATVFPVPGRGDAARLGLATGWVTLKRDATYDAAAVRSHFAFDEPCGGTLGFECDPHHQSAAGSLSRLADARKEEERRSRACLVRRA